MIKQFFIGAFFGSIAAIAAFYICQSLVLADFWTGYAMGAVSMITSNLAQDIYIYLRR